MWCVHNRLFNANYDTKFKKLLLFITTIYLKFIFSAFLGQSNNLIKMLKENLAVYNNKK
jgi:hypothetical protein